MEATPGGAKLPAESRPYLVTALNDWESASRRVPSCPALFRPIPLGASPRRTMTKNRLRWASSSLDDTLKRGLWSYMPCACSSVLTDSSDYGFAGFIQGNVACW